MNPWLALARADRVNVLRDPMLLAASAVALPLGLLVRAVRGPLVELAARYAPVVELDALLGSFVLVLPALMAGTVQGFLLLEERDEGVEAALRVSPVGLEGLQLWRLGASFVVGLGTSAVAWGLAGLPPVGGMVGGLVVAGLHGPLVAMTLSLARDKVQGLAFSKVTSLAAVAQVTLVLPGWAGWLGAPFPAWWLARGLGEGGPAAMVVAVSLAGLAGSALWRSVRRG